MTGTSYVDHFFRDVACCYVVAHLVNRYGKFARATTEIKDVVLRKAQAGKLRDELFHAGRESPTRIILPSPGTSLTVKIRPKIASCQPRHELCARQGDRCRQ